jgi:S-formylglutathione hydrolase FrmB
LRGGCGDNPAVPRSHYTVTHGVFDSQAMHGEMPWVVALPMQPAAVGFAPPPLPVVLCLTGLGDDVGMATSGIGFPGFATAAKLRMAFAIPGGGGDLYWHPRADGRDPFAWAVEEFLPMVERRFGVGGSRDNRATLGWSMGGFGALLVAQLQPDLVSAVAALSPAVFQSYDAARGGHAYTFDSASDWERYGVWPHLGDLSTVAVRIDCGNYDPFAPTARQLLHRIPGAEGAIGSGCHDEAFWRRSATRSLQFLAANMSAQRT